MSGPGFSFKGCRGKDSDWYVGKLSMAREIGFLSRYGDTLQMTSQAHFSMDSELRSLDIRIKGRGQRRESTWNLEHDGVGDGDVYPADSGGSARSHRSYPLALRSIISDAVSVSIPFRR